jgi:hypothetical protein
VSLRPEPHRRLAVTRRVLNVLRPGYYEWVARLPRRQENELLFKHIKRIHAE